MGALTCFLQVRQYRLLTVYSTVSLATRHMVATRSYVSVTFPDSLWSVPLGHCSRSTVSVRSMRPGLLFLVAGCPGGLPLRPGSLGSAAGTMCIPLARALSSLITFLDRRAEQPI
jgi:hypothetical protein